MGGSILVVEDEAAIRDLLAANLQRAGYKVMCAGDVPQAEALVRDTRPTWYCSTGCCRACRG